MKKNYVRTSNQKGFTLLEVALLLVILAIIGAIGYFAYSNLYSAKKVDSKTATNSAPQTADKNRPPAASELAHYVNPNLGFSFDYPKTWRVVETKDGDKISKVMLFSADHKSINFDNGLSETTKGAVIAVYPAVPYTGDEPDQFTGVEKELLDDGTITLEHGSMGNFNQALQYSYATQGITTFYARLPFKGMTYIQTSLQSEGEEGNGAYWNTYSYTVGSIR